MATDAQDIEPDTMDDSNESEAQTTESSNGHSEETESITAPFIVRFYGEEAKDDEGRSLDDICAFTDDELEYHHDYIQVIFPLPERSGVNRDAPLIDKDTCDAFLEHEHLRKRLFTAFSRMARFYAFEVDGDENDLSLSPMPNFEKVARNTWLTMMDHNHLRITRIIRCLRILGLEQVAQTFYQALLDNERGVSSRSLMYWERAAKRPLCLPPDQPDGSAKVIAWLKEAEEYARVYSGRRDP